MLSRTVERSAREERVDGKKRASELENMVSRRTSSNNRELDSSDGKEVEEDLPLLCLQLAEGLSQGVTESVSVIEGHFALATATHLHSAMSSRESLWFCHEVCLKST